MELVRAVVRSKSDGDALSNALKPFLGREVEVHTLKGARGIEAVDHELRRHLGFKGLVVVLLGLEDKEALSLAESYPWNFAFHLVPKSRVRNERPRRLLRHYLEAKAELRLRLRWLPEASTAPLPAR